MTATGVRLFGRAGRNGGDTESFAYTEVNDTVTIGADRSGATSRRRSAGGLPWSRMVYPIRIASTCACPGSGFSSAMARFATAGRRSSRATTPRTSGEACSDRPARSGSSIPATTGIAARHRSHGSSTPGLLSPGCRSTGNAGHIESPRALYARRIVVTHRHLRDARTVGAVAFRLRRRRRALCRTGGQSRERRSVDESTRVRAGAVRDCKRAVTATARIE